MPLVCSEKPSDLIACRIKVSCRVACAIPHVFFCVDINWSHASVGSKAQEPGTRALKTGARKIPVKVDKHTQKVGDAQADLLLINLLWLQRPFSPFWLIEIYK